MLCPSLCRYNAGAQGCSVLSPRYLEEYLEYSRHLAFANEEANEWIRQQDLLAGRRREKIRRLQGRKTKLEGCGEGVKMRVFPPMTSLPPIRSLLHSPCLNASKAPLAKIQLWRLKCIQSALILHNYHILKTGGKIVEVLGWPQSHHQIPVKTKQFSGMSLPAGWVSLLSSLFAKV